MKNKLFSLFLILVLALSLCACGGKDTAPRPESGEASAAAESTAAPAPEVSAPEQPAIPALPDAGLHEQEETPEPYAEAEIAQRLELAKSFLEKDVQDLIDALGEPLERSYAPSCLGTGEDGELRYEGFSVYTFREGERETVIDVA